MINLVPYHSVRVLVLVVWDVITVEVGAGGTGDECSSPTALWFSLEPIGFHQSHWVLPLLMLLISQCPACSSRLN